MLIPQNLRDSFLWSRRMYKRWLAPVFLLPSLLFASPETACRRMQAHLLVGDLKGASSEAHQAIEAYPFHELVYKMAIKSLSVSGEEGEMMLLWEAFKAQFPQQAYERDLLEEMAWGILQKGCEASGVTSQLISVIGAALTQDARAIRFLLEGMRHSSAHIRTVAVELGSLFGDEPFREEIVRLFQEETVLDVRLEVIKAVGHLRLEAQLPGLMRLVADPKRGAKEKLAAIEAIVKMRDRVDREELEVLASSKRAGLRQLAAEAITHCEMHEAIDLVIPLLKDSHPSVVASALKALGLLRVKSFANQPISFYVKPLAYKALDPKVSVTASWVLMLSNPQEGERALASLLEHEDDDVRAFAASAVAAAGPFGVPLARKMFQTAKDPYVRANLALALIGQREACEEACQVLDDFLKNNKERWMMDEKGLFQTLQKSTLSHNPAIPNFPEAANQTVRLSLLNLLAILEYKGAEDALKSFLLERRWGVTGLAAETLLGEGDETAIALVRNLLEDPDKTIRKEAALVLAVWGRDPAALKTLMQLYPDGDRQLKIQILESLGRLGGKEAIPFLVERLKEPSLLLRMIASSVLIQTLNH